MATPPLPRTREPKAARFDHANLRLRLISAAVLIPVVLACLWLGGIVYNIGVTVTILLAMRELLKIVGSSSLLRGGKSWLLWIISGSIYLFASGLALLMIRGDAVNGAAMTAYLVLTVWATDTGAYVAGKIVGGPKLLVRISPSKTWSGLCGGMVAAATTGAIVAVVAEAAYPVMAAIVAAILAIVAQGGDLLESWVKRRFNVKDSGNIIPGHGGMLDRIDGLLAAALFLVVFNETVGNWIGWW